MGSVNRPGSGSKLEVGGIANLPSGYTIMGWLKWSEVPDSDQWVVHWSVDSDSMSQYHYSSNNPDVANGELRFGQWDHSTERYTHMDVPLAQDTWYFLAVSITSGGVYTSYWKKDGETVLQTADNSGSGGFGPPVQVDHIQFFDSPWGGEWFNGSLTGLKMWQRILTQPQIEAEMNQREAADLANIIGEWHLESVGDWADQSGQGNDLTGGAGLATDPDEPNDLAGAPPAEERTVAVSGGGTVTITAVGSEAAQRTVEISGGGTVAIEVVPKALRTVAVSGGGTVAIVAVGSEAAQRTVAVSGGGTVAIEVSAGAVRTVAISGGGTVAMAIVIGESRPIAVSGGGTVTITVVGSEAAQRTVEISGGGAVIVDTSAGGRRAVTISGGGTVAVAVLPRGLRTVAISGGGTVTVTAFGTEPGQRFIQIRGGGTVEVRIVGPFISPRLELEELLRTSPHVSPEWTIYGWPPDNLAVPALVIRPANPYQAPSDLGATVWALWVDVTVARAKIESGLARIEAGMNEVRAAIRDSNFRWIEASQPDDPEVAGRTYLRSSIGVGRIQDEP